MRLSGRRSYLSEFTETGRDISESFGKFPLAFNLAVQDILGRYRGSILGPWWITIMTMTLVLGIGINYAALMHQNVHDLLPYVAVGLVVWNFLSSTISEGGDAFVSGAGMIKQSPIPLPLFILRCIIRNLISLAHQVVIIVGVLVWFQIFPGSGMLWALAGLALIIVNLGWLALVLAMASARFRDMPQIVAAVLQMMLFLSPIFWTPTPALAKSPFVTFNPFYFAIETIRAPLLHGTVPPQMTTVLIPLALAGWVAAILYYNQTRRRVVHYL